MATAIPATTETLQSFIHAYVTEASMGNPSINLDEVTIANFMRKCALMFTLPQNYKVDKLNHLIGEDLPAGGYTEEYFVDPIMPEDYDPTGKDTLAPNDATFRKNYYNLGLTRKKLKITTRFNDLYLGVMTTAMAEYILSDIVKKWVDSRDLWMYGIRKQALGNSILKVNSIFATTTTFAANTAYSVGAYLRSSSSGTIAYGVVFKNIPASGGPTTWANAVAQGYIVDLTNMRTSLSDVTDADTGEAFVTQIKKDVENTSEPQQGYSLSGNLMGIAPGLVLYVKNGIMPTLDVKTLAGAFHTDRLAIPARVVTLRDFGDGVPDNVMAFMTDERAIKVHTQFRSVRTQLNADGDFLNNVFHYAPLARLSANTYLKLYTKAQ